MEGLVLGSIPYKENSKIIYLLTENGKDSVLVRNAKKLIKNETNQTQILNLINYEKVKDSGLSSTKSLDVLNYYQIIKDDMFKYSIASGVLEIINNHLDPNFNSSMLYNLLIKFLAELTKRDNPLLLYIEMKIKLLYFLGINPNFKNCIHCGKSSDLFGLSIEHGGMECNSHKSESNIGPVASRIIMLLYSDKSLEIDLEDKETVLYLYQIIEQYYETHFGLKIKSESIIGQLLQKSL